MGAYLVFGVLGVPCVIFLLWCLVGGAVRNIPAVVPYAERQTLAKIQQYALRIVRCNS